VVHGRHLPESVGEPAAQSAALTNANAGRVTLSQ
jgi:hypothetical protein